MSKKTDCLSEDIHRFLIIRYKTILEIEEKNNDKQKLESLLSQLKDINARDANNNNDTLLHSAVKVDNDIAVELLLKYGASVNINNSMGQTPLEVANSLSPKKSDAKKKILTLLEQKKEREKDERDSEKMEAEISRVRHSLSKDDVEKGNLQDIWKKIDELIGYEMPFVSNNEKQKLWQEIVNESCDEDGNTPLILCAKNKDSEKLIFFLEYEADVNKENNENMRAADYSWRNRDYISLLKLYEKKSIFPKGCSEKQVKSGHEYEKVLKELIKKWENNNIQVDSQIQCNFNSHSTSNLNSSIEEIFSIIEKDIGKLSIDSILTKYNISKHKLLNEVDENGNTPLILSASKKKHEILKFLLNNGAEVNKRNNKGYIAIENSWKNGDYLSMICLLKKESYFYPKGIKPENIKKEKASGEALSKFIAKRIELHEAIKEGNLEQVKQKINENQESELFLNPCNKSARYWAAECNQIKVLAFLLSKGALLLEQERKEYRNIIESYKEELIKELDKYLFELEDSPVKKLVSQSTVFGDSKDKRKTIYNLFGELYKSKYTIPIINILQFHPVLFSFHFDGKNTQNKDPDDPDEARGSTDFINGRIHIAAKGCNIKGDQREEVIGTLAHEMAHQTIHLIYNNQCNPYRKDDINSTENFEKITVKICHRIFRSLLKEKMEKNPVQLQGQRLLDKTKVFAMNVSEKIKCENVYLFQDEIESINMDYINSLTDQKIDPIISDVFIKYEEKYWHRELIVRIPHMIAKYGEYPGEKYLRNQAPELLQYYSENVIPKMEQLLQTGPNSMRESMKILGMNENFGIMKAIGNGKIRLETPKNDVLHDNALRAFKIVKTLSIQLCTIYFYQILREEFFFYHMQCLFIYVSSFENNIEKILNLAKGEVCRAIVLVPDNSSCCIEKYENIFIGSKAKIYVIMHDHSTENVDMTLFEWHDLTENSKIELLEKEFVFCDSTVALSQLLKSNQKQDEENQIDFKFIDAEALSILVEENFFKIDDVNESNSLKVSSGFYFDRVFCKFLIQNDILSEESKEYVLYITNISAEDLSHLNIPKHVIQELNNGNFRRGKRILINNSKTINSDKSLFSQIKEYCQKNNSQILVHWLNMEKNGCLTWEDSNGKIDSLLKFVDTEKKIKYEGKLMANKDNKIVILSDMPGMGKSTVLSKLQGLSKNKAYWTVRYRMADFVRNCSTNVINQMKDENEINLMKAIEIISDIKFCNPLIKSIFKICCFIEGKIVLIFDGFDEVKNEYRKPIINLFRSLISSQIMQIWISARSNEKEFLEKEFGVLAFTLNDWNDKDQIRFLNMFWKKELQSLDEHDYYRKYSKLKEVDSLWRKSTNVERHQSEGFSININIPGSNQEVIDFSQFIDYLISQLNVELKKFVKTPLHTLILANVIFEENFKIENSLNIYKLYKYFIQHMFQRYYEKCQLDFKNCIFLRDILNEKLLSTSQYIVKENLSLDKKFFYQEIYKEFQLNEILNCFEKIGLCTSTGQLLHQNIAEYLFVEWIFANFQIPDVQKFCVDRILMEKNFSVVRQLISSKIEFMTTISKTYSERNFLFRMDTKLFSKPEKLLGILERIVSEELEFLLSYFLKEFPEEMVKAVKTVNKKKQNILHHACKHGKKNILCILFNFIKNTGISRNGDKCPKEFIHSEFPSSFFIKRDEINITPFQYAVKTGQKEFVESFITNMEDMFRLSWSYQNLIDLVDSALHVAVFTQNEEVIEFLWQKIKNDERVDIKSLYSMLKKVHQKSKNAITHLAAYSGCTWLIKEIFSVLSKVNNFTIEYLKFKNDHGFTFIHVAVLKDDVGFLADLISILGGHVNQAQWRELLMETDNWKDSALHKSPFRGHTKTLKKLLEFSSKVLDKESFLEFNFLRNKKGYTAFHKSVYFNEFYYFEIYWKALKDLLSDESFLDLVKVRNEYDNTVLHTASSMGNLPMVEKLCNFLQEKNEINFLVATDSDKDTVLHKASIKGHIDVLLYISEFVRKHLKYEEFIDFFCICNKHGNNILHLAVRRPFGIHANILKYAREKLTEEHFKKFEVCVNFDGETFETILTKQIKKINLN